MTLKSNIIASIVCVTKRRTFLDELLLNFSNQKYPCLEFIVVLHGFQPDDEFIRKCDGLSVKYIVMDKRFSFGHALNMGFLHSQGDFKFKFDDDDIYASNYVENSMMTFSQAGSSVSVVGRKDIFWLLTETSDFFIRRLRYAHLVGASIAFKRCVLRKVCFERLDKGEDSQFLSSCSLLGMKVDCNNAKDLCAVRYGSSHHTWRVEYREIFKYE